MDVFGRVFGDWRCMKWMHFPFGPKKCREKSSAFSKYEYYAFKFQSIVIWEHPTQTVSCLLVIQLLFWMIVNLCWKFYGIIFTLLLIFCTHDVWTDKIWPEIRLPQPDAAPYREDFASNPRILTMAQIEEYFNNLIIHAKMTLIRFRNLRNSHPTLFCSLLSACFGLLTVIGCTISGIWLLYMIVMTVFLSPGVYIHVLPQSVKTSLRQYFNDFIEISSLVVGLHAEEDEDYVPKLSKENLDEAYATVFRMNDASNDFLSIDKDDLLVPSVDTLPSFDDSSLDDLDRFISVVDGEARINLDLSEDSSVSSDASMKFQGAHFDSESDGKVSSDDDGIDVYLSEEESEKAFLPDLQRRRKASDSSTSTLSAFVSGLTLPDLNQLGKNWFPHASKSSPSTSNQSGQSHAENNFNTDDEFEFINESDLN